MFHPNRAGLRMALAACCALAAASAQAQRTPIAKIHNIPADVSPQVELRQCGDFTGHFGPLDYRVIDPGDRGNVESNHFNMELQTFLTGKLSGRTKAGTGNVVGGFDYVLKAIPNHPAALLVMEQLSNRLKSEHPQNNEFPVECYYLRAFMIAPDDPVVRGMYGIYLANRARVAEAAYNLDLADAALRESGPMQHQIGLANITLKRYDKAQLNALRVAQVRFQLDVVERQLKASGHWNEALSLPASEADDRADAASATGSATAPAAAASTPAAR